MKKYWLNVLLKIFITSLCVATITISPFLIVGCSSTSNNKPPENNQEPPSSLPNSDLNQNGGFFSDGLVCDKYIDIANKLNINKNTIISNLTNDILNNELHQHKDYEQLNISILDGSSEINRKLRINFSGNYLNKNYNEQITISGFNIVDKSFQIKNFNINKAIWFDSKQPIKETNDRIFSNDKNLLISILSDCTIVFGEDINNSEFKINQLPDFILIESISFSKIENNKVKISLRLKSNYKKFVNNKWVIDDENNYFISQSLAHGKNEFNLLTLDDLKLFMLDNIKFNEQQIANYYPSYFYANYLYQINNGNEVSEILNYSNATEIINKYKPTYFPNTTINLINSPDKTKFIANDFIPSLTFDVIMKDYNEQSESSIARTIEISNLNKNISELASKNYNNQFQIKDDSNLKTNIVKICKNNIDQALNGANNSSRIDLSSLILNTIYDFERHNVDASVTINNLNKNFSTMQIFNQQLSLNDNLGNTISANKLNTKNGLYYWEYKNNSFFIENISFSNLKNLIINFQKNSSQNAVDITINTQINIGIKGGESIQNVTMYFKYFPNF